VIKEEEERSLSENELDKNESRSMRSNFRQQPTPTHEAHIEDQSFSQLA
jgi:hypothetical protein